MNYFLLLLFLMIIQLDAMNDKSGQKIYNDLMELVALIGPKKGTTQPPTVLEIASAPVIRPRRAPIKQIALLSEAYGIQFERIKPGPGQRCKYKCLTCGITVTNYKPHAVIHTNERPYVCACGSSYKQRGHLNEHKDKCIKEKTPEKNRFEEGIEVIWSDHEEVEESEYDENE